MNCKNTKPDEALIEKQHNHIGMLAWCCCGNCKRTIVPGERGDRASYKCLYCETYYCTKCAEEHFGMTRNAWKINNPTE